jgi:hypothetical protein
MPAPTAIGRPLKSPAPLPTLQASTTDIDRYGYLDARYLEAKSWLDEREALKKTLQDLHKDAPAALPIRLEGDLYAVILGVRENQQTITNKPMAFAALRRVLGIAALTEALSYTLKLLDLHVPKDKQAAFISTARTGPRSIRSVIKSAPTAA